MDELDRPIGERVAIYRRRRGLSQAVLAGLVGRSESWLSQVERGARSVDRLSVLIDMAKVLKVDIGVLTGQPFTLGPNGGTGFEKVDAIRSAVLDHHHGADEATSDEAADLGSIENSVHEAQSLYQRAQYARVGDIAPALNGALLLVAAIAASREDDRREALRLIRHAGQLADRLDQDRNDHWTAFGPTNVRIHATSSAVELGDPVDAVRQADTIDTDRLAPGLLGRRSQVHVDLAWAYGQQRNDPATVLSLIEAERTAPEAVRYNVAARELVRECLKRERRTATPGLRGLADRIGVTD